MASGPAFTMLALALKKQLQTQSTKALLVVPAGLCHLWIIRMALTAKQRCFVSEYLIDLNATQAAIRAGYSEKTARQIAQRMLSKVDIQDEISKRMKERELRTGITADQILREVAAIALSPLGDEFVKTTEKIKALELAGKRLALWTDKQQISGDGGGPVVTRVEIVPLT